MEVRVVETVVHGRSLYERRSAELLLVGFHGYAENAEINFAALQRIPVGEAWSLLSIQALHPFYTRQGEVVANWMTRQDREYHIADNISYVGRVLDEIGRFQKVVFLGFSQGAAMAFRAAARYEAKGVVTLGAEIPPEVVLSRSPLPPVLLGRGRSDEWYSAETFARDVAWLRSVTSVSPCEFDGGHEWSDEFRSAAGEFLTAAARR